MTKLFRAAIHSGGGYTWNTIGKIIYVTADNYAEAEDMVLLDSRIPWESERHRRILEIREVMVPIFLKNEG